MEVARGSTLVVCPGAMMSELIGRYLLPSRPEGLLYGVPRSGDGGNRPPSGTTSLTGIEGTEVTVPAEEEQVIALAAA